MLIYFSILIRCATVDDGVELIRSLPRTDGGLVLYLADAEKLVRVVQSAMEREIEIVEDELRWNANFPNSATVAQYSIIEQMDDATSLFARNRMKRLESSLADLRAPSTSKRCTRSSATMATPVTGPACGVVHASQARCWQADLRLDDRRSCTKGCALLRSQPVRQRRHGVQPGRRAIRVRGRDPLPGDVGGPCGVEGSAAPALAWWHLRGWADAPGTAGSPRDSSPVRSGFGVQV